MTITGTGLLGTTRVRFGRTAAPSFSVHSDEQIAATTPTNPPGGVPVTVQTPAGKSAVTTASRYTYT